ncbi:MAG: amylo-alpha-1,6-glucosidase [Planctomycetota bacterium]
MANATTNPPPPPLAPAPPAPGDAWTTHRLALDGDPWPRVTQDWLLTNGTGAYAAGTPLGCNTRRYHALLVAPTAPPLGRVVVLNQTFDTLELIHGDDPSARQRVEFSSCMFRDDHGQWTLAPDGHAKLVAFTKGLDVAWTYRWGEIAIERRLALHDHDLAATLSYRVTGLDAVGCDARLHVAPMITLRDYHGLMFRGHAIIQLDRPDEQSLVTTHRNLAAAFHAPDSVYEPNPDWWYGVFYCQDAERGQGDSEDYFIPGAFVYDIPRDQPDRAFHLTAALGDEPVAPQPDPTPRLARLNPIAEHLPPLQRLAEYTPPGLTTVDPEASAARTANLRHALAIAADDFVVTREYDGQPLSTILAGYPWFGDWGRDTFIALPGLMLVTGRHREARDTLHAFAHHLRDGIVPNRFDDYGNDPQYNTVDASLWFIKAAADYLATTDDTKSWKQWLAQACCDIVDGYAAGNNLVTVDKDGLVNAGNPHTQLTWMDAACNGVVFTPRYGKACEINALWHHALVTLSQTLPDQLSKKAKAYKKLATKAKRSYVKLFRRDDKLGLYDHAHPAEGHEALGVDANGVWRDASIRPNQLIAAALPNSPLSLADRKHVVDTARRLLLTPQGIRTLPQDDWHYHPHYTGHQFDRDGAYHQGTVWAWLIGPYVEAVLRAHKFSARAHAHATDALRPLADHVLSDRGLGQIHEIFDADPTATDPHGRPHHRPVGTFAQAWSVSEFIRAAGLLDSQT